MEPDNGSVIWGVMPSKEDVEGTGRLLYYPVVNGVSRVEFSTMDLFHNSTVTAVVVCENEELRFNMTPVYADYSALGEPFLMVVANAGYIGLAFFIVLLTIILLGFAYRFSKT